MRHLRSLAVLLGTLLCVAATVGLFARAYPMVDVGLTLDRAGAIARARSLAAAAGFAPARADAAAQFQSDDSLSTYVDFTAGGADSVRALAHGRDLPLYRWVVRLYRPGDVHETQVAFAPDGRVVGLARRIPEAEPRPLVTDTAGRLAADVALARWGSQDVTRWRLTGRSVVTQPRSARVDRTYRYERVGARIGDAPLRADVTVTGPATADVLRGGARPLVGQDAGAAPLAATPFVGRYGAEPLAVHVYADLPDAWNRRYAEMRASNDTLALLPYPVLFVFVLGAIGALVTNARVHRVRWRPAAMVGGTVGVLMAAAAINGLPLAWFDYDTATAPGTLVARVALGAVASGAAAGVWVMLAIAAAEVCARRAFPEHYDWFAYPRFAGAPPIARRILAGYALAAFGFAYVTVFYVAMRGSFGWWVPTGTLDDPNQIATPAPWVSAAGTSLFAGTWEEAIFRGVPLALLAFWARGRRGRGWWLAAGVVVTALTFGFGHANYPSWPAYSRGVELFLEAVLWAVLALRVGLPTTIVAHTLYDLTWFGLFALHGRGAAYRATTGAVLLAFALPALVVAVNWWQRRRAAVAGLALAAPPRFADVTRALDERDAVAGVARGAIAVAPAVTTAAAPPRSAGGERVDRPAAVVGPRTRLAAGVVTALAVVVALAAPLATPLGPDFTASRARVATVA
ncbi:MAG TPA: CPBP family intramembrane glutamic endopeptidase, partial [Gemmatirosa sp.]